MSVLTRYLNSLFLSRLAGSVVTIALFVLLFDLLEVSEDLADEPSFAWALARYAALRVPTLLSEILPIAALLAALFVASELLRSSELVVMWASGLSVLRIMLMLIPAGVFLVVLKMLNDDFLVPRSVEALRDWGVGGISAAALGSDADHLWVIEGHDVARLPLAGNQGGQANDVMILRRTAEGALVERIRAGTATFEQGSWRLHDVTINRVGHRSVEQVETLDWPNDIAMDKVGLMARSPREIGLLGLIDIVRNDGYGVAPTGRHRTWLYYRLSGAFVPMLMSFLGLALAYRFSRGGGVARLFFRGIAIGFTFLIVSGLCIALGEAGFLLPSVAAVGPTLLLAALIFLGAFAMARRVGSGT